MLESLLKYDPALYAAGAFELTHGTGAFAISCGVAAATLVALAIATRLRARAGLANALGLTATRTALLVLVLLVLFAPALRVDVDERIRGHVAVLLDDSASMRIADADGEPRGNRAQRGFAPGAGTVARVLEERFDTRHYRFSQALTGAGDDAGPPTYGGARSRLDNALAQLAAAPDADSLAAVVVVSDGGVEAGLALDRALTALGASGIRVHAVSVTAAGTAADVEVEPVRIPDSVLVGEAVEVEVGVRHRGFAGRVATLVVEREGTIVAERPLAFSGPAGRASARVAVRFDEPGPQRMVFRVTAEPPEANRANNLRRRTIGVRGDPARVLHFEGQPRFEVKFLRRAIADDPGIRLVSLVRTAENKFYRLGIEDPTELESGFPDTDEALFRYDAVVIGSADADLLGDDGQRRLRDFVSRRGGGLVALGGRRAFAEGGFAGSVLSGLLPVALDPRPAEFRAAVAVRPTPAADRDRSRRLVDDEGDPERWARLPRLTVVNPIRAAKPGATVLLEGEDDTGEPLVVLATHRYGRGSVTAFAARNTWRWQMHPDLPPGDLTHEQLWSRLLRDATRHARPRSHLHAEPGHAARGDRVTLRAAVMDAAYRPRTDADVRVRVTTPLGALVEQPLAADPDLGGYRGTLNADDPGRYDLALLVDGEPAPGALGFLTVEAAGEEFFEGGADPDALARAIRRGGGRLFDLESAARLPDALDDTLSTVTTARRLPLWDVPLLLLVILALACLEWAWRRRCALP